MPCEIHNVHVPKPHQTMTWVKSDGEPVEVCPTGFYNIEERVNRLINGHTLRGRPGRTGELAKEFFAGVQGSTEP